METWTPDWTRDEGAEKRGNFPLVRDGCTAVDTQ